MLQTVSQSGEPPSRRPKYGRRSMAVAVHGAEPPALGVAPGGVTSAAVATVAEHTAASTTAARQNVIDNNGSCAADARSRDSSDVSRLTGPRLAAAPD